MKSKILISIFLILVFPEIILSQINQNSLEDKMFKQSLLNDLLAIFYPNSGERFDLYIAIKDGSVFDPPTLDGTAYLCSSYIESIFKSNLKILERGRQRKAEINIETKTSFDYIRFHIWGNSSDISFAARAISKALIKPKFDNKLFLKLKDSIALDAIKVEDSPQTVALQQWHSLLFSPFPYGGNPHGSFNSLKKITIKHIISFYNRCIIPNRTVLLLSAPINELEFHQFLIRYFALWTKSSPPPYTFSPSNALSRPRTIFVKMPETSAFFTAFGTRGLKIKHEDYAAALLTTLLIKKRLNMLTKIFPDYKFDVFCSKLGLGGFFLFTIEGKDNFNMKAIDSVISIVNDIAKGKFTLADFRNVQKKAIDDFNNKLKTHIGFLESILNIELYRLGTRYIKLYPIIIKGVIKEDLQFIAVNYISQIQMKFVLALPKIPKKEAIPQYLFPYKTIKWSESPTN